jgi:hypothetical protein
MSSMSSMSPNAPNAPNALTLRQVAKARPGEALRGAFADAPEPQAEGGAEDSDEAEEVQIRTSYPGLLWLCGKTLGCQLSECCGGGRWQERTWRAG